MHKKALLSEMNILLIQYMIHKQVNGIMTMALICGKIEYSVILFVDLFQKIHALKVFLNGYWHVNFFFNQPTRKIIFGWE